MGIISGFPVGAKIVNKFVEEGTCSKSEAERMLAFTNNSGPLFVIGTVGISLFNNSKIGVILFITQIMSCITVGLIFGFISKHNLGLFSNKRSYENLKTNNTYKVSDLGTILSNSITNATSTVLLIGGFIVLFSIIISILNNLNIITSIAFLLSSFGFSEDICASFITGLLELTNGVNSVSLLHLKHMSTQIIATAFLIGFAGFSIFLQIFSIASKTNLSMKPYFIGKVLQGIFSGIYVFIILTVFDCFHFNL